MGKLLGSDLKGAATCGGKRKEDRAMELPDVKLHVLKKRKEGCEETKLLEEEEGGQQLLHGWWETA